MSQDRRHRTPKFDVGAPLYVALAAGILAFAVACGAAAAQPDSSSDRTLATASVPSAQSVDPPADHVPVWQPDYPRDLDHIRETVGSVFLPTYLPDDYRLAGAAVNANDLLLPSGHRWEASLVYRNGFRGIGGELVGEFFIYQYPEGWDGVAHIDFEELTIGGLTVRRTESHKGLSEFPAFFFQVDGRWLWISVFGDSEANVDNGELPRIAKSVGQFNGSDPIDWLTVAGVTEHGFDISPLAALENIVEKNGVVYVPSYLPSELGLRSVWLSEYTGDIWLQFRSPDYLDDAHLDGATLMTLSHPIQYADQVDVGDSTGYIRWGVSSSEEDISSSDVSLVFEHDGHWFALEVFPASDPAMLDELIKIALSLSQHPQS